jgi:hypothetical protein
MNDEMNMSLSVTGDGEVLKCAKMGADVSGCGYTPGAKLCAKCGAMPTQVKIVPVDEPEDEMEDEMEDDDRAMPAPRMGNKPAPVAMEDAGMEPEELEVEDEEDEESMDEEKTAYYKKYGYDRYVKKYGKKPWMMDGEGPDEEEDMSDEEKALLWALNKKRKARGLTATQNGMDVKGMGEEYYEEEDEEDEEEMSEDMPEDDEVEKMAMLERMRKKRIKSLGITPEAVGPRGYLCAIERKAYPGGASVCDDCPGGCVSEKGLPGLLHVEGLAEQMFKGTVLDSGYSAKADMYVIDIQTKTGAVNEVFVDGTTAEVMGFHRLDNSVFEQKSAQDSMQMIQFYEAADIAVKSIDGHVIGVEPDSFEGIDAYAVEIDGFDGKSYDVFVSLDGEVLGYDKYEMDEAEEIEAEAAEIALKRAFTEDQRTSMAKEGTAMPDGSFPIKNESDLRNAIQAYGRAKDKEAAKRHIMKRAKEMGKENLIPSNWVMGGGTEKKSDVVDASLMASLIEFELLQAETEIN